MQDMASVLFPSVTCFLSSNRLSQSLPDGAMAEKTVFRQMHRSLPTTASHVRMTMTVAGLPSRRQERGAFPLSAAPLFRFSSGALRHPTHFISFSFRLSTCMTMFLCRHYFFSFPPLHMYDNVPMPPFQTTSVVIYVAGQR